MKLQEMQRIARRAHALRMMHSHTVDTHRRILKVLRPFAKCAADPRLAEYLNDSIYVGKVGSLRAAARLYRELGGRL